MLSLLEPGLGVRYKCHFKIIKTNRKKVSFAKNTATIVRNASLGKKVGSRKLQFSQQRAANIFTTTVLLMLLHITAAAAAATTIITTTTNTLCTKKVPLCDCLYLHQIL